MLFTICFILAILASVLIILAVLVQSPKSGMAANFGASNQVMGVRQTSDFLEKFTWTMAIAILALSIISTMGITGSSSLNTNSEISKDAKAIQEMQVETQSAMPQAELPAVTEEQPATPAE